MSAAETPAARRPFWRDPYFLAFVVGAIVVTVASPRFRKIAPVTEVTGRVPDVALVDQDGAAFGTREMSGRACLIGLVSERAMEASDVVASAFAELEPRFGTARADVALVLLDLDGRSPEQRREWLAAHAPPAARWRMASGPQACALADAAFGSSPLPGAPCAGAWAAARDARLAIVDASGQVRGTHGASQASLYETFERTLRACDIAAGVR